MILTEQREERFLKSKNAKSFFQHLCLFQNTPGRTELGMPTKQPAAMLQSRLVKLIKLSFHQSLCKFSNVSNSAGVICKRWHWREWGGEDCFQLWQRALRLSIQVKAIIILFTELTACSSNDYYSPGVWEKLQIWQSPLTSAFTRWKPFQAGLDNCCFMWLTRLFLPLFWLTFTDHVLCEGDLSNLPWFWPPWLSQDWTGRGLYCPGISRDQIRTHEQEFLFRSYHFWWGFQGVRYSWLTLQGMKSDLLCHDIFFLLNAFRTHVTTGKSLVDCTTRSDW